MKLVVREPLQEGVTEVVLKERAVNMTSLPLPEGVPEAVMLAPRGRVVDMLTLPL